MGGCGWYSRLSSWLDNSGLEICNITRGNDSSCSDLHDVGDKRIDEQHASPRLELRLPEFQAWTISRTEWSLQVFIGKLFSLNHVELFYPVELGLIFKRTVDQSYCSLFSLFFAQQSDIRATGFYSNNALTTTSEALVAILPTESWNAYNG